MRDGIIWEGGRPPIAYGIENVATPTGRESRSTPLADAISGRDGSMIPPWFLQVVIIVLVTIVVMLWLRVSDLKADLDTRLRLQEVYTQNSREKLAENGWKISTDGTVSKP